MVLVAEGLSGRFTALATYGFRAYDAAAVRAAAVDAGLAALELPEDPAEITTVPRPGLAWRCPPGLAVHMHRRGTPLPVTGASGRWFAELPQELTGRRLQELTVQALLAGEPRLPALGMVKLADLKHRHVEATRVRDLEHARRAVAGLPGETRLLLADRWLSCHSEYRVFCLGARALTCSPYRIEDELWSPYLDLHRASFHAEAAEFAGQALLSLRPQDRPPACVLDVARLDDGRLVLLEANTAWGAGAYGCDPDAVLACVLAANLPADRRWSWPPGS